MAGLVGPRPNDDEYPQQARSKQSASQIEHFAKKEKEKEKEKSGYPRELSTLSSRAASSSSSTRITSSKEELESFDLSRGLKSNWLKLSITRGGSDTNRIFDF